MSGSYAIWREDTPASVSGFRTRAEALSAVKQAIEGAGTSAVGGWSLVYVPDHGEMETVAEGPALIHMALSKGDLQAQSHASALSKSPT